MGFVWVVGYSEVIVDQARLLERGYMSLRCGLESSSRPDRFNASAELPSWAKGSNLRYQT